MYVWVCDHGMYIGRTEMRWQTPGNDDCQIQYRALLVCVCVCVCVCVHSLVTPTHLVITLKTREAAQS